MNTLSLNQISSTKYFLFGLIIGFGGNAIIDLLLTVFLTLLNIMFFNTANANVSILAALSFLITLSLYVALLLVMHKELKNKSITIGTAVGLLLAMLIKIIQSSAL